MDGGFHIGKKAVFLAIIVLIALTGFIIWQFTDGSTVSQGIPEAIVIAAPPVEGSALLYIAEEKGLFSGNGLNMTIMDCDTAQVSIDQMKSGKTDLSLSSEYPVVKESFNNENISIIGCIDKYQSQYLIGRKDRGITSIPDLKGKKIGVHRYGIEEFYLGRFLNLGGIGLRDVTLVDIGPSKSANALVNGDLDAAQVRQTDVASVKDRLGSNAVIWPAQNSQNTFMVVACRNEWAAGHPDTISKFLKSLSQAEEYSINHPDETKEILRKKLNYSEPYMDTIWQNNHFSLSLDQSLVTAMEDEGRWMIGNNLTTRKMIPDYRNYFYLQGLEEVKPESSNIIG
jgi:NitT/TauT family transport system substrate-binding protein